MQTASIMVIFTYSYRRSAEAWNTVWDNGRRGVAQPSTQCQPVHRTDSNCVHSEEWCCHLTVYTQRNNQGWCK